MRTTGLLIASAVLLAATAGWAQSTKPAPTPPLTAKTPPNLLRHFSFGHGDNTKVSVDLDGVSVKEALKKTLEKSGQMFVLDDNIPEEPRVSLKVKDARLSTVLDLLTEVAGVGWNVTLGDGKPSYRVGKDVRPGLSVLGIPQTLDVLKHGTFNAPDITAFVPNRNSPLSTYVFGLHEERSTFTCPHCKGQTTLLRQRQQPKCTKCSRAFQNDWQFCPADGAKRPATPNQWKFCPHCGKEVKIEKSEASPFPEANDNAFFEIEQTFRTR